MRLSLVVYNSFRKRCKELKLTPQETKLAWVNYREFNKEEYLAEWDRDRYTVGSMFIWSQTPQGIWFWYEINNRQD